jgi:hypothetical protein
MIAKEFFAVYRKQLQVQLRTDGGLVARTLDLHPRQPTMHCNMRDLEERNKHDTFCTICAKGYVFCTFFFIYECSYRNPLHIEGKACIVSMRIV